MKKRVLLTEQERHGVSAEKNKEYVEKLSSLINCKTVWTRDGINNEEFGKRFSSGAKYLQKIF